MPFVRRNAEGHIVALLDKDEAVSFPGGGVEQLSGTHPDVVAFLGTDPAESFNGLDAGFIRVMEDLIDVLIEKGVLRLTDLPVDAQRKLLARKDMRRKLQGALDLLGDRDVI
ncbi:MAG: hypothetical protein JWL63_199 [Rhodocyclales bacterium]|nr:hypothetical protein [Rhodocyclales bacterium]